MSFFTTSWKTNGFNRRNFITCQTTQIVLLCLQLYFSMIMFVESGLPSNLQVMLLLCVLGGFYSFFSPKRLTAVDAIQSNGA